MARAFSYLAESMTGRTAAEQMRIASDLIYLFRGNPALAPLEHSAAAPDYEMLVDGVQPDLDPPALSAMVARHEGPASAALFDSWLARAPEAVALVRDLETMRPRAFWMDLDISHASPDLVAKDPIVRRALDHGRAMGAPAGRALLLQRFWMDEDAYQAPCATTPFGFRLETRAQLLRLTTAMRFYCVADAVWWTDMFAAIHARPVPGAPIEVGDRRFLLFARDLGARGPEAYLAEVFSGSRSSEPPTAPAVEQPSQPPSKLSREQFDEGLRRALRSYRDPVALSRNVLLEGAAVTRRAAVTAPLQDRVAALQALIAGFARSLDASPRTAKWGRALSATYLTPIGSSQERVAEELGLPFSTYRDHLTSGIKALSDRMWLDETDGLDPGPE